MRQYGPAVVEALTVAWAATNYVCAKRLVPFLPELVASLERHGHLALRPEVRTRRDGLCSRAAITAWGGCPVRNSSRCARVTFSRVPPHA